MSWNVELREGSRDGELREEYDKRTTEQFCGFPVASDSLAEFVSLRV